VDNRIPHLATVSGAARRQPVALANQTKPGAGTLHAKRLIWSMRCAARLIVRTPIELAYVG
jgi:invasion protein IalB